MWVIKILTSNGSFTQLHFESMEEASAEYEKLTDGVWNNDDNSILKIQIDAIQFPSEREQLN